MYTTNEVIVEDDERDIDSHKNDHSTSDDCIILKGYHSNKNNLIDQVMGERRHLVSEKLLEHDNTMPLQSLGHATSNNERQFIQSECYNVTTNEHHQNNSICRTPFDEFSSKSRLKSACDCDSDEVQLPSSPLESVSESQQSSSESSSSDCISSRGDESSYSSSYDEADELMAAMPIALSKSSSEVFCSQNGKVVNTVDSDKTSDENQQIDNEPPYQQEDCCKVSMLEPACQDHNASVPLQSQLVKVADESHQSLSDSSESECSSTTNDDSSLSISDDDEYDELLANLPVNVDRSNTGVHPSQNGAIINTLCHEKISDEDQQVNNYPLHQQEDCTQKSKSENACQNHNISLPLPPKSLNVPSECQLSSSDSTASSYSSTTDDESSWSSSDDDEYEELMATMPIALGRSSGQPFPSLNGKCKMNDTHTTDKQQQKDNQPGTKLDECLSEMKTICHNHQVSEPQPSTLLSSHIDAQQSSSDSDSTDCSSEDDSSQSSSDDDEFEELMSTMPVTVGLSSAQSFRSPMLSPKRRVSHMNPLSARRTFATNTTQSPKPCSPALPDVPVMECGLDLSALQSIRADLEKVGRMIVAKKDGQQFLKRAQILASINWLASHVPTCVLDHLGKEIRGKLDPNGMYQSLQNRRHVNEHNIHREVHFDDDDHSQASELSNHLDENFDFDNGVNSGRMSTIKRPLYKIEEGVDHNAALTHANNQSFCMTSVSSSSHCSSTKRDSTLPYVSNFRGALLFADISGFTKLSTRMDPENLSKVINSYFNQLVDKVFEFGGDIQKFAGDAFFAEWRESSSMSIHQCVAAAALCASSMVHECSNFPILSFGERCNATDEDVVSNLNIHCGLGVGGMLDIHVGDNTHRRECLYIGDPIDQATAACDCAALGEVVASQQFSRYITELDPRWSVVNKYSDKPNVIANRNVKNINLPENCYVKKERNAKCRGITEHVDGLQVEALIEYRRLMALYVHPVVVCNDVAASNDFKSNTVQERRKDEAELRSVYVMFIKVQADIDHTKLKILCKEEAALLNNIMNLVTRELEHHCGHLRQFVFDDKGLVLIATFGLRGSTYPNMISERALPATLTISHALEMELGVQSRIGATFGDVYCGPVGGESRHEFAVMGRSVNLAARLMSSEMNPGILVDKAVQSIASRSFCFNALDPVLAKGYEDPVPIYEPLASQNRVSGKVEANFAGRRNEISKLVKLAKDMISVRESIDSKIVMISGPSGLGKTSFLRQSMYEIRRNLGANCGVTFAIHSGVESDILTPFSTVRSLLFKIASHTRVVLDDVSCLSGTSEAWTFGSQELSGVYSEGRCRETILNVCNEQNSPIMISELAKQYLFGNAVNNTISQQPRHKQSIMSAVATYISNVLLRFIQDARLVLIGLDDVHRADEFSWQVLRHIFELPCNILILGTTHSVTNYSLRVKPDFWRSLSGNYTKSGRFLTMELQKLSEDDIVSMIMKTLGLQRKDVNIDMINEVYIQSGGVPRFASKILEAIKHRSFTSQTLTVGNDHAVMEIILHRVDSFEISAREVLYVSAVLGSTFTFGELMNVLKSNKEAKETDIRKDAIESLKTIVNEGILYVGENAERQQENSTIQDKNDTRFSFYLTVWRKTILGLMLASRKKAIHKMIALSLESSYEEFKSSAEFHSKSLRHWIGTGDTNKASSVALRAGIFFEVQQNNPAESLRLYEDSLGMWGWEPENINFIGGFSRQILELVTARELSNILSIYVARSRALKLCNFHQRSARSYENALKVIGAAKTSSELRDRSVIFPAYDGIINATVEGYVKQDVYRRYEQSLVHKFLNETRTHRQVLHHIYALYLQMDLFGNQGEFDKAVATQSLVKKLYKSENHSYGLIKCYGRDAGALSFSMCSSYYMLLNNKKQALRAARHVLKEVIPKVEAKFEQLFMLVYPLVFVLKQAGHPAEARAFFERIVVTKCNDSVKEEFAHVSAVHGTLCMLLTLSAKSDISIQKINEYAKDISSNSKIYFGEQVNLLLARLGYAADSISAELCAVLAQLMEVGEERDKIIKLGNQIINQNVIFLRKTGLMTALKHAHAIRKTLDDLSGSKKYAKWSTANVTAASVLNKYKSSQSGMFQ